VSPRSFGIEGTTDEDRAYRGSRFSEVCEALFANPYQRTWGADGEPPLPVHPVTLSSLLYGILPFGPPYVFRQATERAVDSAADLRWGPDRKGFRRLVHPNGICLTGLWQITEDTGYSGYFRNGSRALVVGRYSTCCRETRRGQVRSLSLVGKMFPTGDPDHAAPLRTASFMTQQDIGGDYNERQRWSDPAAIEAEIAHIRSLGIDALRRLISDLTFGFARERISARRSTDPSLRSKKSVLGPWQFEIVAQRFAFVFATENSAPLQFRHHAVDEIIKPSWKIWKLYREAVGAFGH
jgi:hypothetical protein